MTPEMETAAATGIANRRETLEPNSPGKTESMLNTPKPTPRSKRVRAGSRRK
jgi:hypothetical protein